VRGWSIGPGAFLLFTQTQLDTGIGIWYTGDMDSSKAMPTFLQATDSERRARGLRPGGSRPFVKPQPLCDLQDLYSKMGTLKPVSLRAFLEERGVGIEHVYENGKKTGYRPKSEFVPDPMLNVYPTQADVMFEQGVGTFVPGDWITNYTPTGVVRYMVLKPEPVHTPDDDVKITYDEMASVKWTDDDLRPPGPTMGARQASKLMQHNIKPGERITLYDIAGVKDATYLVAADKDEFETYQEEASMNQSEFATELVCATELTKEQRETFRKITRQAGWADRLVLWLLAGAIATDGLGVEDLGYDTE